MSRIIATVAATLLLAAPSTALADEAPSLEQIVVEMADSPAEHAAIAAYYEQRAADAREEASKHEKMGQAYQKGRFKARNKLKDHCVKLAKTYRELAGEYEAMAKLQGGASHH